MVVFFRKLDLRRAHNMMIGENDRFKEMYQTLKEKINIGTIPLVITEGKTDIQHIKKSKEKLSISDCDVEFFEVPEKGWGSSQLKTLLENLSKVPQTKKIVGIFDSNALVLDFRLAPTTKKSSPWMLALYSPPAASMAVGEMLAPNQVSAFKFRPNCFSREATSDALSTFPSAKSLFKKLLVSKENCVTLSLGA